MTIESIYHDQECRRRSLRGASLDGADFTGADLSEAVLDGAVWDEGKGPIVASNG